MIVPTEYKGANYIKIEVQLADGSIHTQTNTVPVATDDPDAEFVRLLSETINNLMKQVGFPHYSKQMIPMISINEDELPGLVEYINEIRPDDDPCSLEIGS